MIVSGDIDAKIQEIFVMTGRPEPSDVALMLAAVDQLASQSVVRAAPIQFEIARSAKETEAVYHLRYQVAIERGWATPADMPSGLEHDIYDDRAVQVVGWDKGQAIAVARLVFPDNALRLPTEDAFELQIEPRGEVVDINRVTVVSSYSDLKHRVLSGLLGRAWLEIRAHGFNQICAFAALPLLRLYRLMGLKFKQLGPEQLSWSETRYPILFDIAASAAILTRRVGNDNGKHPFS